MLIDPRSTHRLEPEGSDIVYLLRVPTVADRPRYRHAVRVAGGRQWSETQLLDAMADGVREILAEDDPQREDLLAAITDHHALWHSLYADIRSRAISLDSDRDGYLARISELKPPAVIRDIEAVVLDHYPRYASMVADREVYQEIAAVVAARMFLEGWEGGEAPYTRGRGDPPDDVLWQIPMAHLGAIGREVERLLEPEPDRVKNSVSLSGSAPDQAASNGTGTPRRNGRSRTTTGHARSSASPS